MKKLLAIAAALIAGGFAMPNSAEAAGFSFSSGSVYVSGRSSCGCAIQSQRVFAGHDRYHRPIYRYVQMPIVHHCRTRAPQHRSNSHYGHGYSNHYDRRSNHGNRYDSHRNYGHSTHQGRSHGNSSSRHRYGR